MMRVPQKLKMSYDQLIPKYIKKCLDEYYDMVTNAYIASTESTENSDSKFEQNYNQQMSSCQPETKNILKKIASVWESFYLMHSTNNKSVSHSGVYLVGKLLY